MKDRNNIGDFFKEHLSNHKEDISLMDLDMMNARMAKTNFLKFNARTFNVYYVAAIASGFMLSLVLGTHYLHTYRIQNYHLKQTQEQLSQLEYHINTLQTQIQYLTKPKTDDKAVKSVPKSPSLSTKAPSYNRENLELTQPLNSLNPHGKIDKPTLTELNKTNNKDGVSNQETPSSSNVNQQHSSTKHNIGTLLDTHQDAQVVIYKRDTIFEYDTLKIKKNRK